MTKGVFVLLAAVSILVSPACNRHGVEVLDALPGHHESHGEGHGHDGHGHAHDAGDHETAQTGAEEQEPLRYFPRGE